LDQLAEVEQVEQLGQQVIRVASRRRRPPEGGPLRLEDFSPRPCTRLLILQPTPFCNLDCDYCYLPGRADTSRMGLDTVRAAARRLREDGLLGDELTVVWHAGEPLVLPPSYYEEAFAAVAAVLDGATCVTHAIQTNATLIDDAWCRCFLHHGVAVGVSVDGPAALHDRHRRSRRGAASHARVMRGMAALRAHGVPFHAIAVVTADTLADPDAFYDWFEQQGITELGCNFDEAEGVHRGSSLAGHEAAHGAFLARLLERSLAGPVVVRELAAAWRALREPLPRWHWRGHALPQNSQAMPLALVTICHNGDFGTFSPELPGQQWPGYDNFILGNVHRGGYLQALQGAAGARLWQGVLDGVRACEHGCAYFDHCGGGAPANKLYELGDLAGTETLHCRAMIQRPFDAVLRRAESEMGLAA
jgi:uncharacterized protein